MSCLVYSKPSNQRPNALKHHQLEGHRTFPLNYSTTRFSFLLSPPDLNRTEIKYQKKQAEELEIKFRKEQGIEDFVPAAASAAKKVSSTPAELAQAAAKADPSNLVSQTAAAAALSASVKSTPETRSTLVSELDGLPAGSKQVIEKMGQLKSDGLAPR